jgi:CRP-like cAMP-binding protein
MEPDLIDRLAEHKTLGAAPRPELEWLAAHGSIRKLDTGEVLSVKGRTVEALYIILSGRLALFVDRGAGLTKIIEWREGDVAGLLPYSRLVLRQEIRRHWSRWRFSPYRANSSGR